MVYYVAFYARPEDKNRRQNLAGVEKANYIVKIFSELGYDVTILSNAKTLEKKEKRVERVCLDSKGISLYTFTSWGKGNRIKDVANAVYGLIQLFFFFLLHVKEEDIVCVYHSMGYRGIFKLIRKFRKFKYILEVEELFQYFEANNSGYKKKENGVFREPDAFIFSNKIIADEINIKKKPQVIVNGVYKNEKRISDKEIQSGSDTLKLVYAGSLEPQKGINIIMDIVEHLDEDIETRIIGFGSEDDVKYVTNRISALNLSGKEIKFDGTKTGKDYREYLQQCDIGLCVQDDTDIFNRYEFPSKVISYMANGLNVITNDLIQIKTCELADYINIVVSRDAAEMASYINKRLFKFIDAHEAIEKANIDFRDGLKSLVSKI